MKDEIFDIQFEHNGQQYNARVKTDLPVGPEPFGSDYDIYFNGKLTYILNHCKNEDEIHCWEIKKRPKKDADPELPQAIGKAIDTHYM